MLTFRLEVDAPPSKKNRQRIVRKRGKPAIIPSKDAISAELLIHTLATGVAGPGILWPDEDIAVEISYYPRRGVCVIEATKAGDKPKAPTGRTRDIANLSEVILDALQRVVYTNDNQVSKLTISRMKE